MRWATIMLVLLVAAGSAAAQQLESWYEPVDQAVADWNALSTSGRVIDPGLAQFSDRVSLFRPLNPYQLDPHGEAGSHSYILQKPGLTAWVPSPEYLSLIDPDPRHPQYALNVTPVVDKAYFELISAGTVFDLTMPAEPPTAADLNPALDARLDLRLDYRVGRSLPLSSQSMPPPIVGYGNAMVIDEASAAPPRASPGHRDE